MEFGLTRVISHLVRLLCCSHSELWLGVVDVRKLTDSVSNLSLGDSLGEDFFHLIFLFLLLLLRFGSYFPLLNV